MRHFKSVCSLLLLALLYVTPAAAISIHKLVYDAKKDQLVMQIAYRGTNEDHQFSVQWTECRRLDDERSQILGNLIDSQANDRALEEFKQEFKVDLRAFSCRPAKVTIRTSVGMFFSVDIPEAPKNGAPTSSMTDARNAP